MSPGSYARSSLHGRHYRAAAFRNDAKPLRADIQGLRTVAVGLVIVYHIWPEFLPGGFIGVDIFFVISGFLIVGSLVRELSTHGRILLLPFYGRRVRRLLPAASLVLLATLAGSLLLLPQSRWQSISWDVIMSGLQVQNWNQAFSADSYAGATALVSPVQHYWSLAVEEQFYLVIPVLLVAGVVGAANFRASIESKCLVVLAAISFGSLVHSVAFSASHHDVAYFATSTRMWELGVGGITALLLPRLVGRPWAQQVSGWAGLGMILFAAGSYSTSMDFPGYVAALPVLGTVLVLVAGAQSSTGAAADTVSVAQILSRRPMTFIGDVSYSLYLWHWPVVVFYVFHLGRPAAPLDGAVIVGLSMVVAVGSYFLVEQKFRHAPKIHAGPGLRVRRRAARRGSAYRLAAVLISTTSILAMVPWGVVEAKSLQLNQALNLRDYPGATAFDPHRPAAVPDGMPVRPDPSLALKDRPLTDKDECGTFDPAAMSIEQCVYGDKDASRTLVVVGDSHAAQYVDPLLLAGSASGWNVRAMVRNGCPFSAAPPADGATVYYNCSEQNKASLARIIELRPDLVVVSGMSPSGYKRALNWEWDSSATLVDGYVTLLRPLGEAGIRVVALGDNPYPDAPTPDCVLLHGAHSQNCITKLAEIDAKTDPLQLAAGQVPGVEYFDMSEYFCQQGACPAVVGNVLVYRDNHLTNSYAKTLAPILAQRLTL